MQERIARLRDEAVAALQAAEGPEDVERLRVRYLGRKGRVTELLRGMGSVPPEERPRVGKMVNELRRELETALRQRLERLAAAALEERLKAETIDVTLPGRGPVLGRSHPLTQVLDEIKAVFIGLGFTVVEGPEVETDYYNFEALNIPKDHPARDMQDTFYITDDILLRTQTSPVQIRTMLAQQPPGAHHRAGQGVPRGRGRHPLADVPPGGRPVRRRGRHVRRSEGDADALARELFGPDARVRFRPSYFPFTEPSAEMDIRASCAAARGCRVCKHEGLAGDSGLRHGPPQRAANVGYDPGEVDAASRSAWASSASPCCATASTTSACSSKTICASCASFEVVTPMRVSYNWLQRLRGYPVARGRAGPSA